MEKYYVTLVRELRGYCLEAHAPDEDVLREYLANNYGNMWCSVYREKPPEAVIGEAIRL